MRAETREKAYKEVKLATFEEVDNGADVRMTPHELFARRGGLQGRKWLRCTVVVMALVDFGGKGRRKLLWLDLRGDARGRDEARRRGQVRFVGSRMGQRRRPAWIPRPTVRGRDVAELGDLVHDMNLNRDGTKNPMPEGRGSQQRVANVEKGNDALLPRVSKDALLEDECEQRQDANSKSAEPETRLDDHFDDDFGPYGLVIRPPLTRALDEPIGSTAGLAHDDAAEEVVAVRDSRSRRTGKQRELTSRRSICP